MSETVQDAVATPTVEEALDAALQIAPACRTLRQVAGEVNESLGLDWTAAKWRGIWKHEASAKWRVEKRLGEAHNRHVHGQKLHLRGNLRGADINDIHVPYQDADAIRLAAKIIRWWQPNVLVYNGDLNDFPGLSKWDPNPARKYRMQDEVDELQADVLIPLNVAAGKCRKIALPGNHDLRLLKMLWANPELFSVRALQLPELWQTDQLGMEYAGYAVVVNDRLENSHGTRVSAMSGYAAKAELVKRGYSISTITGHVHRAGRHEFQPPYGPLIVGQESPCLCNLEPEYMVDPNWVQGLTLWETRAADVWIEAVTFGRDYTAQVGDKRFGL